MKKFLCYFALIALFAGCSESSNDDIQPTPTQPTPDTPTTCNDMSCAQGCCDGKCVDFRTDVDYCGRCETKCSPGQFCQDGQCSNSCKGDNARTCAGVCVNIANNELHCGGCNKACAPNMVCDGKQCKCADGYVDCDGDAANGCESFTTSCECTPGATQQCYPYAQGTAGKGICKYGKQTCTVYKNDGFDDIYWSECKGAVGPIFKAEDGQTLDLSLDNNCDGTIDADEDYDHDGYTRGQGDCCDSIESCNVKIDCPEDMSCKVNDTSAIHPGTSDYAGVDANCDGKIDPNAPTLTDAKFQSCSTETHKPEQNAKVTADDAMKLAKAMDICEGLISAELLLADGTPLPQSANENICGSNVAKISPSQQIAVLESLGNVVKPIDFNLKDVTNHNMAVLSSGQAAGIENTQHSQCVGTEVEAPAVFLAAHNGVLPTSTICGGERKDTRANDSVMLRLKLKAPQTARSFSFQFKFFSKEYPKFVCDDYNDFFLALVDSPTNKAIPADHNIAFDENKNPISVNNAFFTECDKSKCKKPKGCSDCSGGTSSLAGYFSAADAGATSWLKTSVPVSGGEEFTLDLIIFDGGQKESSGTTNSGYGHQRDSLVLLDAFAWGSETTIITTTPIVN